MRSSTAVRLSIFYAAFSAPGGVQTPFIPIWFAARGMTPPELGLIGFATILARTLTAPVFGSWADRRGGIRLTAIALGWLAAAAFVPHFPAAGFFALLGAHLLFTILRAPPLPLGEALALAAVRREGLDYGRIRVWGSVAFLVVATAVGPVIDRFGPESIAWLLFAMLLVAAAGCHLLPGDGGEGARTEPPRAPVRFLLAQPVVLVFLAASALIQASHSVFYAYGSIHWARVGLSQAEIGVLWSAGVTVEIALFWYAGPVTARFGPAWLLVAGGLAAVPRWGLTAIETSFWPLLGLQFLHAATYGLTHLGSMHFVARFLPATHAASAQTLLSAAINLAIGVGMWATGPVFAASAAAAYWSMAGLGLLGALAAAALPRLQPAETR